MIKAEIVADSLSPQGDRLTSLLITFPRIILAEINTHRMLSKNTSSSRAIPFMKMVEVVRENPFVPIAWQKTHPGMQGSEYLDERGVEVSTSTWLVARNKAVEQAEHLVKRDVTKQLANRLLEPFMWTTMLITGSKEGWDNFFELRCPQYHYDLEDKYFKSRKEWLAYYKDKCIGDPNSDFDLKEKDWFSINKGQAEIHIMDLAEKIYDIMNESIPEQLSEGMWHIPFMSRIDSSKLQSVKGVDVSQEMVKISTAMAARTSYTVVGDEKEVDYEKMIGLHDRLIEMRHDSPLEHCARAMDDSEYQSYIKGKLTELNPDRDFNENIEIEEPLHEEKGWCRNFKGFIQYRHIIETSK